MNALAFICECERDVGYCLCEYEVRKKESEGDKKESELKSLFHLFYHMDVGNGEDGRAFRFLRASIKTSFELLTCSLRRFKLASISFPIAECSFFS